MLTDESHPKGALVWTLLYLALVSVMWVTTFFDLWGGR